MTEIIMYFNNALTHLQHEIWRWCNNNNVPDYGSGSISKCTWQSLTSSGDNNVYATYGK